MHFITHTDAGLLGGGALIPLVALAVVGTRGVNAVSIYTGVTATLVHIYKRKWRANAYNVNGLQMAAEERKKREKKEETRGEERRKERRGEKKREEIRRDEIRREEK